MVKRPSAKSPTKKKATRKPRVKASFHNPFGVERKPPKGCYYDEAAAQWAVDFLKALRHTKGRWKGQLFNLLPWQEKITRDVFGWKRENGKRLFRTVYIEVPKKNGKSEWLAAILLLMTFGDEEMSPNVFSAAADKDQTANVFGPAADMFDWEPALQYKADGSVRGYRVASTHRIINLQDGGFLQALSADVKSKHGLNVSAAGIDELHAHPNRLLYDVLTEGSGDAREQPLFFIITTAGTDRKSICYELHEKARQVLNGTWDDPTFYGVIYGLSDEEDQADPTAWEKEATWKRCNPSVGYTIDIETVRQHYREAKKNPAKENLFRQLRLNQWVKSSIKPIPLRHWDDCGGVVDEEKLRGRVCYGGLDLARSIDLAALALVFPWEETGKSEDGGENIVRSYDLLMRYWMPEATVEERLKRGDVTLASWIKKKLIQVTPGATIDYAYIRAELNGLRRLYDLRELAYDRWGSVLLINELQDDGFVVEEKEAGQGHPLIIQFGQGFASMAPATSAFINLVLEEHKRLRHGGNPVLRWNVDNLVVQTDPAGNMKPDKSKASMSIDGAVAAIMGMDRAIRHEGETGRSQYEDELITIG